MRKLLFIGSPIAAVALAFAVVMGNPTPEQQLTAVASARQACVQRTIPRVQAYSADPAKAARAVCEASDLFMAEQAARK